MHLLNTAHERKSAMHGREANKIKTASCHSYYQHPSKLRPIILRVPISSTCFLDSVVSVRGQMDGAGIWCFKRMKRTDHHLHRRCHHRHCHHIMHKGLGTTGPCQFASRWTMRHTKLQTALTHDTFRGIKTVRSKSTGGDNVLLLHKKIANQLALSPTRKLFSPLAAP